jgi:MerR family transcriptional regulator, copper efflux regulator
MARDGLLIGEVAAQSGISRKALRLYEGAGILPPPSRTASGYRLYSRDTLALLVFVSQARRLGFRLDEIKSIVSLKRSGRTPCSHVADLVHMKLESIEHALADLTEVQQQLRALLRSSQSRQRRAAVVCPCIEHLTVVKGGTWTAMDNYKVTLCPAGCGACPEVEFAGDEVRIGEAGNLAVLKKNEWNLLVDLIQKGQLTKV